MKLKEGFTLIELLAVIVILALIALVSTPIILDMVETARYTSLEVQASYIGKAAMLKTVDNPDYDFSDINASNLRERLSTEGKNIGALSIENNHGKITATVLRDNMVAVYSNDPVVENAKVYGLSWDGANTFTRTNDATSLTTVQVGVGTSTVTNNFDTAEIYSEMMEVTDSYGNVFIKIPKFYIKKTVNGDAWTWQISKDAKDSEYYLPACFVDETNGKILPYILVGKYNASLSADTTKLESKSGKIPLVSKNITQFRGYARANGTGYQLIDIHTIDVLQTLFYIEFATLDSQSIMYGYASGQYSATHTISSATGNTITLATGGTNYVVGQMIDVGTTLGGRQVARNLRITNVSGNILTYEIVSGISETPGVITGGNIQIVYNVAYINGTTDGVTAKSGSLTSNSNGKYAMKYRGIENFYANIWQFIDGINIKADNQAYASKNADNYVSDKFNDDYIKIGYANANTSNYVLKMGYDKNNPYIQLPVSVTGTYADSKYKDYYYQTTGNRVALLGGSWLSGLAAGSSYWRLSYSSTADNFTLGSRLLKTAL